MRLPSCLVLALAAPVAAQASTIQAPPPATLAAILPADSYAYAECIGNAAAADLFRRAAPVALTLDMLGDDGQAQVEKSLRQWTERPIARVQRDLSRLGLDLGELVRLIAGPMAIAVGRPTLQGQVLAPSMALVATPQGDPAQTVAALEQLLQQRAHVQLERGEVTVAGVRCATMSAHGVTLLHGRLGDHWVLTNSPGYLADMVATSRGSKPSLADNAALVRSRNQMRGQTVVQGFVNVKPLAVGLQPLLPYEAGTFADALGIAGAPDLYLGFGHDGKSSCDVMRIDVPGSAQGMLKAGFARPVSNRAAQWVGPETSLFASLRVDVRGMKPGMHALLEALPDEVRHELHRELDRELGREIRRELGMPPEELMQALSVLGSEVSVAIGTPSLLPPWVDAALFVELADPAGAAQVVPQLLARSGMQWTAGEVEGARTWSTSVHVEIMRMTPTVAITDDGWLIASNMSRPVKRALARRAGGEDTLAQDPRFRRAAQSAEGACLFLTARAEPLLKAYWSMAAQQIRAGGSMIGVEDAEVPEGDQVAGAIDDVVLAASVDDSGVTVRSMQPLGFGTLLTGMAAAIEWASGEGRRRVY